MNKHNFNKLKGRIKEYCGTNETFANQLGISNFTLYQRLRDIQPFTLKELDKAIEILHIEQDEIKDIFFNAEVEENSTNDE